MALETFGFICGFSVRFPLRCVSLFCKTSRAMRMKCLGLGLLAALILASGSGCKKSASDSAANQESEIKNQKSPTLARVHWLGKNRIAAETNAARFLSLWNLPESARLETQTLDKLAVLLTGEPRSVITNPVWTVGEPPPTNIPPPVSQHPNSQPSSLNQNPTSAR